MNKLKEKTTTIFSQQKKNGIFIHLQFIFGCFLFIVYVHNSSQVPNTDYLIFIASRIS